MNARLSLPLPRPLLLLLLTSALAVLGNTVNDTLPASCPAEHGGTFSYAWLQMIRPVENRKAKSTFYLHHIQGLRGVGLRSSLESKDNLAWIPLPETCFPDDTVVWWKMEVEAGWTLDTDDRNNTLVFKSKTGMCNTLCVQAVPYNASIKTLDFMIHGPYGARFSKPDQDDCHTMEEMKGDLHVVNCTAPDFDTMWGNATTPAPATTPDPATTDDPATTPSLARASYAVAVEAGVLVLVLVNVVLTGVLLALVAAVMQTLKQIYKKLQG